MNQQREKTCSRGKKIFLGEGEGLDFFPNFRGQLAKKCKCGGGGVDQHSFLGAIALCRGG